LWAFAVCTFAQLPFVVWGLQAQAGRSAVIWAQWPFVQGLFTQLGVWTTPAFAPLRAYAEGDRGIAQIAAFWLIGVGTYLVGTLGLRLLALPAMLRTPPECAGWQPVRQVVTAFVLLGPCLSLTLVIVPAGSGLAAGYNNGMWFLVQSKLLLWLFAVEFLWRATSGSAARRSLAAVAVLAFSIPSAVEFFVHQARQMGLRTLDPALVDIARLLEASADPGAVVLARAGQLLPLLCITTSRGPTLRIYPEVQLASEDLVSWQAELRGFWRAWNRGFLDEAALSRLGAAYVLVDRDEDAASPGAEEVRPSKGQTLRLEPMAQKSRYVLYQVHRR
jgi:hypothetical protein